MTSEIFNGIRTNRKRRQGASLVEVLVALLILVIGILSVIRLFPGGFIAIRDTQDANLADRLAQAQLEQLKENNAFLLDAVYMYTPAGFITGFPTVNADPQTDLNDDYPNTTNPIAAYDDINKVRYIAGEQFIVPAANTSASDAATEGVSIHTLNDGPVVITNGQLYGPPALPASDDYDFPLPGSNPDPIDVAGQSQVHSAPWKAILGTSMAGIDSSADSAYYDVPGNTDLPNDLLTNGAPNYAIDYTNQEIALPPATYVQRFTLELKITSTNSPATVPPTTTTTYYIPLVIPAEDNTGVSSASAYDGGWFSPATTYIDSTRAIVVDSSAPGKTQANPLGSSYGSANAPYTWISGSAVLDCDLTTDASITALRSDPNPYTYVVYNSDPSLVGVGLGVLAVNPRLVGQTVSASYMVYDWHILHENDDAPGSAGAQMPLVVDHVQPAGAVTDNQSIYTGIFAPADVMAGGGTDTGSYDIEILDTDTGQSIGLNATNNTGDDSVYNLDTNTGTPATNQFQVSYQNGYIILPTATGDAWSNASHQHLRIFYSGDFDWAVALQKAPDLFTASAQAPTSGEYEVTTASGQADLKFPAIDAGQTIEADDVSYTDTNGNAQTVPTVTGTVGTDFAGTNYINLSSSLPNVDLTKTITIGAVRGISVNSVVIWKERGNWKTQNVSTILNQ